MKKIAFHCECGERLVVAADHVGTAVCKQCDCENEVPGLHGRKKQSAPEPVRASTAVRSSASARHKTERRGKVQSARNKTNTSRHSIRRTGVRGGNNWVPVAGVCGVAVLVLVGLALAFSGGEDEPAAGGGDKGAGESKIEAFVNGQAERREAYMKTFDLDADNELAPTPVGDPAGERRKLVQSLRQLARRTFKGSRKADVDAVVDRVVASWKKEAGRRGQAQAPDRQGSGAGGKDAPPVVARMPSIEAVRLFLDTLPAKKKFLAACYKAVTFEAKETRDWWQRERTQAATFLKREAQLRFKGADRKQLDGIVAKILETWRKSGEVTRPPEKKKPGAPGNAPPRRNDPPPRGGAQPQQNLTAQVSKYLGQQNDLKGEFQALLRKFGGSLNPNTNQEVMAFHKKMVGRLQSQFPGVSLPRMSDGVRARMSIWAKPILKQK